MVVLYVDHDHSALPLAASLRLRLLRVRTAARISIGAPSTATQASEPFWIQSSYVRMANPWHPHFSPQEFCTTKPCVE